MEKRILGGCKVFITSSTADKCPLSIDIGYKQEEAYQSFAKTSLIITFFYQSFAQSSLIITFSLQTVCCASSLDISFFARPSLLSASVSSKKRILLLCRSLLRMKMKILAGQNLFITLFSCRLVSPSRTDIDYEQEKLLNRLDKLLSSSFQLLHHGTLSFLLLIHRL